MSDPDRKNLFGSDTLLNLKMTHTYLFYFFPLLRRIACYYLRLGVEQFQERNFEESVEQLTVAYIVNQRLLEDPPLIVNPKLKVTSRFSLITTWVLCSKF